MKGVCEVWRASLPGGCSARASEISGSPRRKRLCFSRCSTTSARTGSLGARRETSRKIFGSRARTSARSRFVFGTAGFSSSMNRRVRVERLGTSSATRARPNLSTQWTGWPPQTCQIRLASRTWSTCLPIWPEGRSTYVGRSAVAVRALPGARRSLRSLISMKIALTNMSSRIGPLAARCPCGEQAQGDLALVARQRRARHVPARLRSCRLPAALADEGEVASRLGPSAGLRRRGGFIVAASQGDHSTRVMCARSINAAHAAGSER